MLLAVSPVLLALSLPQEEGEFPSPLPITQEELIEVGTSFEQSAPDLPPPAGALGGGWMLRPGSWSVRVEAQLQTFDGLRQGTDRVDEANLLAAFGTTITEAERTRWTLAVSRGVTEDVTLTVRVPLEERRVQWSDGTDEGWVETRGLGDAELLADWRILQDETSRLTVGGGLLAPTGDDQARDSWPGVPTEDLLPYWLQLGGGTWQGVARASWVQRAGEWTFGAGALATAPIGENDLGWARERALTADAWVARQLSDQWTASLRVVASGWSDVRGAAGIDELASPLHDNGRQGGDRVDVFAGLAVDLSSMGEIGTNRLEFGFGTPVHEDLDGPGLAADQLLVLRWRLGL